MSLAANSRYPRSMVWTFADATTAVSRGYESALLSIKAEVGWATSRGSVAALGQSAGGRAVRIPGAPLPERPHEAGHLRCPASRPYLASSAADVSADAVHRHRYQRRLTDISVSGGVLTLRRDRAAS